MQEELRAHIEMQTEENLRAGMDVQTARRQARIKFGAIGATKEAWREQRGVPWLEETARDVRIGLQGLRRNPSFAVVTVLTLGITIGLHVAVYAVVEATLLQPLPFEHSGRLVTIYNAFSGRGVDRLGNSVPDFFLRRERASGLDEVALYVASGENVGDGEATERVAGLRVTPSLFPTLGVEASLGRTFLEEEMQPDAGLSVLLTDGYWRARFAASPDVLGRTITIDGQATTIIGVLPATFRLPAQPDARLIRPLVFQPEQASLESWGSNNDFFMLGRLSPGTSPEQLETELATLYTNVARELLGEAGVAQLQQAGYRAVVVDAHDDLIRNIRSPLALLWGAVSFVLLIGCVNIANLMLARGEVRQPELATRAALGAGRLRLARLVVAEATVIGAVGGLAGLALGAAALRLLGVAALAPAANTDGSTAGAMALNLLGLARSVPAGTEVGLPASVLAYSIGLGLATSIVFSVVPVLRVFKRVPGSAFARADRGRTASPRSILVRRGMVAGQVALAFLLLAGAGLMLRSFQQVMHVDPGFQPDGVLTAFTSLTGPAYADGDVRRAFYDEALREVRGLTGVAAAAVTTLLPFGPADRTTSIAPVGYERPAGEPILSPNWASVSPGYFEALGMALIEGREFDDGDGPERPRVLVIDEWLARHFWPDRSPLGQQMSLWNQSWTVIGVVETITQKDLTAAARVGAFYLPYKQAPARDMALVVRPSRPDPRLVGGIRAALNRVDPGVPLFDVQTLDARLGMSVGSHRTAMILLVGFAVVALLLAAVGTYGVLAYVVAQRARETAIRIALGSRPADILAMVVRQGVALGVVGLAAGALGALLLAQVIRSLLFGVGPLDPLVLAVTALVIGLAVVMASAVPARRATRIDLVTALTGE